MNKENEIRLCADVIKSDGVVLYPTDTIWGLGCNPFSETAMNKLFEVKKRPRDKRVILLVNSWEMLSRFAQISDEVRIKMDELYKEIPTTFILEKVKNIPEYLLSEDGSVAVRIVTSGFAYELIHALDYPVTSTSANIAGKPSPTSYKDISTEITSSVDFKVSPEWDKGSGKPSKIIKLHPENGYTVIRD